MVLTNWELAVGFATWAAVFYSLGCRSRVARYGETVEHMKGQVKKLTKSNSSLIADLNTGLTITTSQRDEYNRIVQEHKVLNEQQNEVVAFIRENFPSYTSGQFNSFSELVIGTIKRKPVIGEGKQ